MPQHKSRDRCHGQIPIFIRPYQAKEEDKALIDKEMKRLCYPGILKEGFSPYSSPVMLISRKLTKDKRVVTDFRHLNVRIAKNNLAYPLLKDTISVLGSSNCEVLSVLDLKDTFHSLRLTENSRNTVEYSHILVAHQYLYQRMPMRLNISPFIWQPYINAIINCLQSKKYCEAIIMEDLQLFTPIKEFSYSKIRRLFKSTTEEWFENIPEEVSII